MSNDEFMMNFAIRVGLQSKCKSRNVGTVCLVENKIYTGYNKTLDGSDCEYYETKCMCGYKTIDLMEHSCPVCKSPLTNTDIKTFGNVIHAEAYLITKLAGKEIIKEPVTLYTTDMPCINCSNLIVNSGLFNRVVYLRDFTNEDGLYNLLNNKIEVQQFNIECIDKSLQKFI